MIEVFDSKSGYLKRCSEKERRAAAIAQTREAREIHQKLAQMYDREAARNPAVEN